MIPDELLIHILDIFSAEAIHLHPIVFGVERSKGMLEENLSSMAYLKTFSAWTKERMRKALLGVHYWVQQPTSMACLFIYIQGIPGEFDVDDIKFKRHFGHLARVGSTQLGVFSRFQSFR